MIIFSSHRMEHIETLCDRVTILTKGQTVLSGNLSEIKQSYNVRTVKLKGLLDADFLSSVEHVDDVKQVGDEFDVIVRDKKYIPSLFNALKPEHQITKFLVCEPTLHDIFIEKVGQAYEE